MKRLKTIASLAALVLLTAGAAAAQNVSPIRGNGVVTSVNVPGNPSGDSYTFTLKNLEHDEATVSSTRYAPDKTTTYCGKTYVAGQEYPMLMVTAPGTPKTQVFIAWEPASDQNAYPLLAQGEYKVNAIGAGGADNTIEPCNRVSLQYQESGAPAGKAGVTVNFFHENKAAGLFGYNAPLYKDVPSGDLPRNQKYYSPGQQFYLRFQDDGNLVVRRTSDEVFIWGTANSGAPFANGVKFLDNGNLALYDGDRQIWSTDLGNHPNARLTVGSDGFLRIVDGTNVLWKSTVTNIPS